MRTKFEISSFKRCKENEKFAKFKSKSRDLDYVSFWPIFLLIFYSLHYVYMLNKTSIVLAVTELFMRKFKMWPSFRLLWPIVLRYWRPNLKSVAVAISLRSTKFQNLKVGQCDRDYVPFWPTFVLLIFYYLQSICVINLNPVVLAVREIFTGVCKFKSRSPKLGHVPFNVDFWHAVKISAYSRCAHQIWSL